MKLLQRFYEPSEGSITLTGTDLRTLDTATLRQQISVVPQEPALFTDNVWYSIRYGKRDANDE